MTCQVVDPMSKQSNLTFCGTGIVLVSTMLFEEFFLHFFG
jgi:hypothetical protein